MSNDSSVNFDLDFVKSFLDDKSESFEPPNKIKTARGMQLKYRLYADEPEIDIVKTLTPQGIIFLVMGYIFSRFGIFGLLPSLVCFVVGGTLIFVSTWSLLWKIFYGINYLHSFEMGEHPVKLDQPTPIALSIKKCAELEKVAIKLECYVYDAKFDEDLTGEENLMFRQILFSEEQIQFQDKIFWISNLSIKPTCLYSTHSGRKKVFWYIIVDMRIRGKNRHWGIPFLVGKP
ncbi:MAG: hypothetical protein LBU34_15355 [Planctomycetaceae bacterium]|jgi:hypothetical protein|nr:hypothetical protein [Planctomycetaceae bacterium]